MTQGNKLVIFILIRLAMYAVNPELGFFGLHGIPVDIVFALWYYWEYIEKWTNSFRKTDKDN